MKNVRLNEGLEKLGARVINNGCGYEGRAFAYAAIASFRLPSTLKKIEK